MLTFDDIDSSDESLSNFRWNKDASSSNYFSQRLDQQEKQHKTRLPNRFMLSPTNLAPIYLLLPLFLRALAPSKFGNRVCEDLIKDDLVAWKSPPTMPKTFSVCALLTERPFKNAATLLNLAIPRRLVVGRRGSSLGLGHGAYRAGNFWEALAPSTSESPLERPQTARKTT